ncbi:diaminobutyrate--2-oxoglutarate transaminase [Kocuria marina]|uniref:diaminobutyrate--2-oxoglutarate transaminase n=1 Tax=Kocuria marina TaxID=223184 RepID=UPI00345F2CBE
MTSDDYTTSIASPLESEVRVYSRSWPTCFDRSRGSYLYSDDTEYLDFFSAAGSLNYGHNDPDAIAALQTYLADGGVLQSLDMQTGARLDFLAALEECVLSPRGLSGYKIIFTGPTGTNAVEAALKCARRATGRTEVVSFFKGFHGVTLGSLAATSNSSKRDGAGVPLLNATRFPFDEPGVEPDLSLDWFERVHLKNRREQDLPACVLMELIQGEGGINVARSSWANGVADLCQRYSVPLIVDEIQTGCGRTGPFFAFENYGFIPDIIPVSKSLSGLGLPLSIVLVKQNLDLVVPGEHNGTFRGSNSSFVTSAVCLRKFWSDRRLEISTAELSANLLQTLRDRGVSERFDVKGAGLIYGVDVGNGATADAVIRSCFEQGLLVESSGYQGEVIKIMPPLIIETGELQRGLDILSEALLSQGDKQ